MNKHLSIAMFLLGACLALGFVYGMGKVSKAVADIKRSNAISVKGYAERPISSDQASWACTINVRDPNMQTAFASLKRNVEECRKFILQRGVDAGQIFLTPIDTQIKYRIKAAKEGNVQSNEIEAYELDQSITVASNDVKTVQSLSQSVTDLISQGIEVRSGSVHYTCSQLEKIKLEMIAEATKNGHERASIIAERSQSRVGKLVSADQGVFQIVPLNSTEVEGYGIYDTTTIEKTIKAVVTLEFAVEK